MDNIKEVIFVKEYKNDIYEDRGIYTLIGTNPLLYSEHSYFSTISKRSHQKGYLNIDDLRAKLVRFIRNINSPYYHFSCKFTDGKEYKSAELMNAEKRKDFIQKVQNIVKRELNMDTLEITWEFLENLYNPAPKTIEKTDIKKDCDINVNVNADADEKVEKTLADLKAETRQKLIEMQKEEVKVDNSERLAKAFDRFVKNVWKY